MFKAIGKVFVSIGRALVRVFKIAEEHCLAEDIITQAEGLVGEAQRQFNDDTTRVSGPSRHSSAKVPESVARLAVELAVQVFKSKLLDDLSARERDRRSYDLVQQGFCRDSQCEAKS